MKRRLLFIISVLVCLFLTACGSSEDFAKNRDYNLKTKDFECNIKITGAERTNLLDDWVEESKTSEIINLQLEITPIKVGTNGFNSFDIWNNIRVCTEDGDEVKPFKWALPGDETSAVMIGEGETKQCTIPYQLEKGARLIQVDIYQDTEYSNKIKLNID